MVEVMKWTEIKGKIADAGCRLRACLSLCELEQQKTDTIEFDKAFKKDGAAYKDVNVVREDVEALCNYMFEDGKIDITNDLHNIQCLAKELYNNTLNKTDCNDFVINCWGVGKVIDDFFTQWQAYNESGKSEAVEQARNTTTLKKGRQSKPFCCQMNADSEGAKLRKIHNIIKGKSGKNAILVIKACIQIGWTIKPTFTQFDNEFKNDVSSVSKALYNKYMNNESAFTQEEINGMKTALKN